MNRIATIVKGYPRLSETFIAQEILGLEKRGISQVIVSLRQPTDGQLHDLHREIAAEVLYLPEYLKDDPPRVRRARAWTLAQPGFTRAHGAFLADLARDATPNRRRRWGQACVLAHELPDDVDWLHTHFLHTPASVTRYAALIRGLGWSFSAHAKDIWTTPQWELREKLAGAAWGATCTQANLDYLRSLSRSPEKLHLVYHGLDFSRFPVPPVDWSESPLRMPGAIRSPHPEAPPRAASKEVGVSSAPWSPPSRRRSAAPQDEEGSFDTGSEESGTVTIVSVGRAVEKKGYGDLLRALVKLGGDGRWRFEHVGGGPLSARLKAQAERLGIADRLTWHGARSRGFVFDLLARADLFVLPSRLTASGDRDGLPNVLMEAQAFGVAVLSTDASGIPELVTHGENGFLVPQRDPRALAEALRLLMHDAELRRRLAETGAERVRARFSSAPGIDRVAEMLRASRVRREAA